MKITNSILTLLGIASMSFGGYKLIRLAKFNKEKKEKEEDEKSNFSGDKKLKTITFKLKNNTNNVQVEYLFDALGGQDNPQVSVSSNLQFFNREIKNIPKIVKKIEFRAKSNFSGVDGEETTTEVASTSSTADSPAPVSESSSLEEDSAVKPGLVVRTSGESVVEEPIVAEIPAYNQAEAPFQILCKDASGNANIQQYTPMVSATQFQSNITSVKFKDLVLDGICLMKYTMYPNSAVNIIVYYEDINPNKLLKK